MMLGRERLLVSMPCLIALTACGGDDAAMPVGDAAPGHVDGSPEHRETGADDASRRADRSAADAGPRADAMPQDARPRLDASSTPDARPNQEAGPDAGLPSDGAVPSDASLQLDPTAPPEFFDTIDAPRGVSLLPPGLFGLDDAPYVVVAGDGLAVHRLTDGEELFRIGEAGSFWDAQGMRIVTEAGDSADLLFAVGPNGPAFTAFDTQTGEFGLFRTFFGAGNATDLDVIRATPEDPEALFLLVVDNSSGRVDRLTPNEFLDFDSSPVVDFVPGATSPLVSLHPSQDGERFVGVTETEVVYYDGASATVRARIGQAFRRMTCSTELCAVPDYAGNGVTLFPWRAPAPPDLNAAVHIPNADAGGTLQGPVSVALFAFDANLRLGTAGESGVDVFDVLNASQDPTARHLGAIPGSSGAEAITAGFGQVVSIIPGRVLRVGVKYTF